MKTKEILKCAKIVGEALYFEKTQILAIGDLHLGQEESFNRQGVFVPRASFQMLVKTLGKIFDFVAANYGLKEVQKVILMGDVKHEFGKPNTQEWSDVLKLFDFLKEKAKEVIVLKGNHDNYLQGIAETRKVRVLTHYFDENLKVLFCHGDKIVDETANPEAHSAKTIIIGHEHAAVTLKDEYKTEKYRCFAKTHKKIGRKKFEIIVMPSLNFFSKGTDLLTEKLLSPYLEKTQWFEIWALEEGHIFYFGDKRRF